MIKRFQKKTVIFSILSSISITGFSLSAYPRGSILQLPAPSRTLTPDDPRINTIMAINDGDPIKLRKGFWKNIVLPDGLAYNYEENPVFEESYYFDLKITASVHLSIPSVKERKLDIGKTNIAGISNCSLIPRDLNQFKPIYIKLGETYSIEGAFIARDGWTSLVVFDLYEEKYDPAPFELVCKESTVQTLDELMENLAGVFEFNVPKTEKKKPIKSYTLERNPSARGKNLLEPKH